ncbi:PilW family protein [Lysinimonas soli]|uniref:PilW family protein n=1 Tax=Lysinimonas soli TaxID=1074233 RepID=A0ABW0NRR4_9MICO
MIHRMKVRLAHEDHGLSLTELLVASMLTLLIIVMVGTMFANTAQLTSNATQNRNSNTVASNIANELRTVIGLAVQVPVSGSTTPLPAVSSGSDSVLVIYSLVDVTDPSNPAPTRVTFDSSTGSLIESRCVGKSVSGFWTFSSCASSSTRNLGGVITAPTPSQLPLFTYVNGTGGALALAAGSLSSASLPLVASITVSVKVQAPGSKTAPVYFSSNVGMPNIGLQQGSS